VKTSKWSGAGSNRRPSAFQADGHPLKPADLHCMDQAPDLGFSQKAGAAMPSRSRPPGAESGRDAHSNDREQAAYAAEKSKTMPAGRRRARHPGPADAGPFEAEIRSFRLHLAAEGKSARTIAGYTGAARWFAAAWLVKETSHTGWDQAGTHDIQQWIVHLLDRYSSAYACIQFRALQQFFKWLAAETALPDPMARLRAPKVSTATVPVFTSVELSQLERACQGNKFAHRRDAAIIAVFTATGIRLAEMAGLRYHPDDPDRTDLDLDRREIRITGKGARDRTVRISHHAARAVDRYLRARARHPQAWQPRLWLGAGGRGPLTPAGIYQMIARRGQQAGVRVHPHRFRHHFSHTWLERGGPEGDLMELAGWSSPRCSPATAPARAAHAPGAPTTASWKTAPDKGTCRGGVWGQEVGRT
jgi:site-specific recombinase XerD